MIEAGQVRQHCEPIDGEWPCIRVTAVTASQVQALPADVSQDETALRLRYTPAELLSWYPVIVP